MEIHDTFLTDLACDSRGYGFALFHAPIFRSEGMVFKDPQESGWQDIRFAFEGMRIEGNVPAFSGRPYASDGEFWVDGRNQNGVILLPADHLGEICMEMRLSPLFEVLKIYATKVTSSLEGSFELEHHWDAEGNITKA